MEIINSTEKENLLLRRKEIIINLRSGSAPSRSEARTLVAKKFSTPQENIRIKKIGGRFGSNEFILTANVYNSKKDRDATEIISKKEKENEAKAAEAEKVAKEPKEEKQE